MAFCIECGKPLTEGAAFCTECGTPISKTDVPEIPMEAPAEPEVSAPVPVEEPAVEPEIPAEETVASEPVVSAPVEAPVSTQPPVYVNPSVEDVPPPKGKYSVVSTASFFWLMLLFSIPVIGWIACIVMAFAPKNHNLKHFARAHLIWILIGFVISLILAAVLYWLLSAMYSEVMHMFSGYGGDVEDIIEQYIYNNYGVFL